MTRMRRLILVVLPGGNSGVSHVNGCFTSEGLHIDEAKVRSTK